MSGLDSDLCGIPATLDPAPFDLVRVSGAESLKTMFLILSGSKGSRYWGSANEMHLNGPQVKSEPPPAFVNKILWGHSHISLLTYCLRLCHPQQRWVAAAAESVWPRTDTVWPLPEKARWSCLAMWLPATGVVGEAEALILRLKIQWWPVDFCFFCPF